MEMDLGHLKPDRRAQKRRKRVGRGEASGLGKTAGRGGKGQTARSGSGGRADFEGGQTPIYRRLPKFGFRSLDASRKGIAVINLRDLNRFPANSEVNIAVLEKAGVIAKNMRSLRVLAKGALKHPVKVKAHHFSKQALEKISEAKGHAEVI